jgi:hypothetical protein
MCCVQIVPRQLRMQVLKMSKSYVDMFASEVLPTVKEVFRLVPEDAIQLLKTMQKPCRFLQRLCRY